MRLSSSTILRMVPLPRWGRQENDNPKFKILVQAKGGAARLLLFGYAGVFSFRVSFFIQV